MTDRRGTAGLGLALTAVLLASACGGGTSSTPTPTTASPTESPSVAPTPIGTVTVSEFECTLEGVGGPISAGTVAFTAVNETNDQAYLDMALIPEGHTYKELAADIEKATNSAEEGGREIHRPAYLGSGPEAALEAGEFDSMTGIVVPGTYGIICLRFYSQVGGPRPNGVAGPVRVE